MRSAVGHDGGYSLIAVVGMAMLFAVGSTAAGVPTIAATSAPLDNVTMKATAESFDSMQAALSDTLPPALAQATIPDFFDTGVSSTAAVLMTPVFPGWGQLYTENSWRAMLAFGAQWYFWSNLLARDRQAVRYRNFARTLPGEEARAIYDSFTEEYWEQMRDMAWWSGAILLIIAVDSYVGSGLYAFEEEPLPVPSRFDEFFGRDKPEPVGSRGTPLLVIWQWGKRF